MTRTFQGRMAFLNARPATRLLLLALAPWLAGVSLFAADKIDSAKLPDGHVVLSKTHSPDGRYGVTAFDNDEHEEPSSGPGGNALVELKTGHVVAVLCSDPAMTKMNHRAILPARWSPDTSGLLWEVDGKWFRSALVLLRVENGKLLWQRDVMKLLYQEILARTRKVEPKKYAKVKKDHADWGSAYPDGFAVEVEALDPVSFPMRVRAALASETKFPSILDSHLEAEINAKGEMKVTKFALGPSPRRKF
jgi:hypothetical protein